MALTPLPVPADPNPYRVLSSELVHDCPWTRLREDQVEHRGGHRGRYVVTGFHRTACGVVALDDQDRVVLVGQWRYPLEQYSWELPEGGGEAHESPFEAIRRELAEEAGLEAAVWEPLCFAHTSNSSTDEEVFLFLAMGLRPVEGGCAAEPDEELQQVAEPFKACLRRVLAGELTDSLTVMGLLALHARRTGLAEPLPAELAERFFQRPAEHPSKGRARWRDLEQP